MLTKISVQGFRGFKELAKLEFAVPNSKEGSGLTIITGPNNSGKSSILECIKARNGYDSPSFSVGSRNVFNDFVDINYEFDTHTERISSLRKGSSETNRTGFRNDVQIYVVPSRRNFSSHFHKNTMDRSSYINNDRFKDQRNVLLDHFSSRLFKIDLDQKDFNLLLNEVIGSSVEWSIDLSGQGNYFLKFLNSDYSHSSEGVGEGIVSLFAILDSLYDSKPGDMIVVDEPELSLHPSLQKRLLKLFLKKSSDRQIVISTHSPYFIDSNALRNGANLIRVISESSTSRIYQLNEEGKNAIDKISRVNKSNPHIFGINARELFFVEDNIIITEGQEDVVLFPEIAMQLNKSFDGEFFGWGAGGASNISHVCTILYQLGFKKVVAILDGNQVDTQENLKNQFPNYFFSVLPADDIRTKVARPKKDQINGILDLDYKLVDEYKNCVLEMIDDINSFLSIK